MVLDLNINGLIESAKPVNGLYILWIIAKESIYMLHIFIQICTLLENIFISLSVVQGRLPWNPIYYIFILIVN